MEPVDGYGLRAEIADDGDNEAVRADLPWEFADLSELHKLGILQEANRLFFHPLGLAMVWKLPADENDTETVPGIVGLAITDDAEGWVFTDLSQQENRIKELQIDALRKKFAFRRLELFGSVIQPIGGKLEDCSNLGRRARL